MTAFRPASGGTCTAVTRSPATPACIPRSPGSPLDQVARQILEDRQGLESVMGYPVRGLAYPNGSWTPEIAAMLPSLGIRYARVVGDTHDFAIPNDFMTWKSTCHHTHQLLEDGKRFAALFKTQYLYMMYVWGHSFEFTCEADWEQMERFCDWWRAAKIPGMRPISRLWTIWKTPAVCSSPLRRTSFTTRRPGPSGSRWTATGSKFPAAPRCSFHEGET